MTREQFANFLAVASVLFLILGFVNLMRPGKRWLGASGIVLFLAAQMFAKDLPRPAVYAALGVGLLCMAMDAVSRSKRKAT